jgi:phenylacetic acid degradation operon negative regulatory protein
MRGNVAPVKGGWSEPPQPQDLVITLLGSYVHAHNGIVWSGGLVELLGEFGFSTGAARVALARLVRRDLIARAKHGRLVHYLITPRLEGLLAEGDRRIFSLGREEHRPDQWTVLSHAIPEERRLERGRLARRLRFLGFGPVQDGTWLAPYDHERDVTRLVEELQLGEHVGVLIGRPAEAIDLRPLIERAWDLGALAARYRTFGDDFKPYAARRAQRALDDREAFLLRTRMVHRFRGFPFLDPGLPDGIMCEPAVRRRAIRLFHAVYDALDEPSQRYFDTVTTAWRRQPPGAGATRRAARIATR